MTELRGQAGFSLLEAIVSTAAIAVVIAGAAGALAAIARGAEPNRVRDLATQTARNQLTYARAATMYAPPSASGLNTASLATLAATRTWALATGPRTFMTSGTLLSPTALCGTNGTVMTVPLTVTTDYEESASSLTFTATVTYPPNPCDPATTASVTLSEELGPIAVVPGTIVTRSITNPPWGE
jgi:type II secretory pathway pseudopilin PulG